MKTNTLQTVIAAARAGARKAWLARLTDDYILLHARAEMIAKAKARAEKLHVRRVKGVGHAARTIGPEWFPGEAVSERTAINRFGKLGYRSFYYVDAAAFEKFRMAFFERHGFDVLTSKFDFELTADTVRLLNGETLSSAAA